MKRDSGNFGELQQTAVDGIETLIRKLQVFENMIELMQALSNSVKLLPKTSTPSLCQTCKRDPCESKSTDLSLRLTMGEALREASLY